LLKLEQTYILHTGMYCNWQPVLSFCSYIEVQVSKKKEKRSRGRNVRKSEMRKQDRKHTFLFLCKTHLQTLGTNREGKMLRKKKK